MSNFFVQQTSFLRFALNYGGRAHLFPVPAFFDHRESKQAMWRERSVQRIREMTSRADLLVYSIGSPDARIPSYVHAGGFLEPNDTAELQREGVVGDIATVFFRFDGSYDNIPLNARASGPELSLFKRAKHTLCIVSGLDKAVGVRAALRGGLMSELIVDEPTARALLWPDTEDTSTEEERPAHQKQRPGMCDRAMPRTSLQIMRLARRSLERLFRILQQLSSSSLQFPPTQFSGDKLCDSRGSFDACASPQQRARVLRERTSSTLRAISSRTAHTTSALIYGRSGCIFSAKEGSAPASSRTAGASAP